MKHTAGFRVRQRKDHGAERVGEDEKDLCCVSVGKTLEIAVGGTHVVLPAHFLKGNGRALGDDQADGVVDDLDNRVGLGAQFGGKDLGPGSFVSATQWDRGSERLTE